jgi:hypothetical protein
MMQLIPNSYKIAVAALHALWTRNRTDSLAILLGNMVINASDQQSMDAAALHDWKQVEARSTGSNEVELILAYLELDASRYSEPPEDLLQLIDALRKPQSQERNILNSVIDGWDDAPRSRPLDGTLSNGSIDQSH